jgi:type VI secretion system protein VasJ
MQYATLGKEPIAGDSPAGGDVRYDPDFETLQAEIDKMSSPTASGKPDWSKVVETAAGILAGKSKDLTVAGYLAVGLLRNRSLTGLDEGLQVIRDLVENYWDNLYPPKKRMRGRQGALAWWLEKTEETLQRLKTDAPLPAEQSRRLAENLKALDALLADKMPDPPLLRPVQRHVENLPVQEADPVDAPPLQKEAPVEEPPPGIAETKSAPPAAAAPDDGPVPAAPAPGPPVPAAPEPAAAAAPAPEPIAGEQDPAKIPDAALQRLRQASLFLLQQDLKSPLAYRYRRIAGWAKLTTLPPHTDKVTLVPPPAPQVIAALKELHEAANWPALIQNAEQKFSQFVFWLDLNRMVAESLTRLGAGHEKALAVVREETAYMLQRLPGLASLSFSDGMPFAEAQTLTWLQSIAFGQGGAAAPVPGHAGAGEAQPGDAVIEEARAMARKKQVVQAIDLLQQHLLSTSSGHLKMRWRMAIVQVLCTVKKEFQALPHLEQVLADIDLFHLEEWNPTLAVEGLSAAWRVFNLQTAGEYKHRAARLLDRIARIDPSGALRLNP